MKINIDMELDWVKDDDTIDSEIRERTIEKVAKEITKTVKPNIEQQMSEQMADRVNKTIDEVLDKFMNREIVVTDNWGDIQEKHESVNELLKTKFDAFVSQQVDKDGNITKSCSWGKKYSRIEHMIDERIEKHADRFMQIVVSDVEAKIKKHLNDAAKKHAEKMMKKAVGFDQILKG